ncbi:MAG TPA: hypothetical protein VIG24_16405, partial [Acidimicrobiia bacterium]
PPLYFSNSRDNLVLQVIPLPPHLGSRGDFDQHPAHAAAWEARGVLKKLSRMYLVSGGALV